MMKLLTNQGSNMNQWGKFVVIEHIIAKVVVFAGVQGNFSIWANEHVCTSSEGDNPNLLEIYHAGEEDNTPVPGNEEEDPGAFTFGSSEGFLPMKLRLCPPPTGAGAAEKVSLTVKSGDVTLLDEHLNELPSLAFSLDQIPSEGKMIVVKANTASDHGQDIEICANFLKGCVDTVNATAAVVDLDIYHGGESGVEVADDKEEAPGAFTTPGAGRMMRLVIRKPEPPDLIDKLKETLENKSVTLNVESGLGRVTLWVEETTLDGSQEKTVLPLEHGTATLPITDLDYEDPIWKTLWVEAGGSDMLEYLLGYIVTIELELMGGKDLVKAAVAQVDLDIDSDNDDGFSMDFERDYEEESFENDPTKPGKILVVHNGDADNDTIPDFVDPDIAVQPGDAPVKFVPLIGEFPESLEFENVNLRFTYSDSEPPAVHDPENPQVSGHLRLWKVDGTVARNVAEVSSPEGHFVKSGVTYKASVLGHDRKIRLYVEGVQATPSIADRLKIIAELDPNGELEPPGFLTQDSVMVTAQETAIDIYKKPQFPADEYTLVGWSEVIFRDEPILVKATLSSTIPSLDLFQDKMEFRVFSEDTDSNWQPISLNEDDKLVSNEIWITLTWEELSILSGGVLPADPQDDVVDEFTSLDWIANPEQSSLNDGNAFDNLMKEKTGYKSRGKARGIVFNYNGKMEHLESPANEDFMKAGGVMFVEFRALDPSGTWLVSEPRQIQNQANVLYYSGHGLHRSGAVLDGFTASDAEQFWHRELDTAIFAGCSVFDIKNYNKNAEDNERFDPDASPGEDWMETGPSIFLGYNYTSPTDVLGDNQNVTKQIVDQWFANGGPGNAVDAWMNANRFAMIIPEGEVLPKYIGTNACAIDLTKPIPEYKYLFKKEGLIPTLEICRVPYNFEEQKWPDEVPAECKPPEE